MWWVICIIIAIAFPPAIIPMAIVFIIGVLKSKNETVNNNNYKSEVNYNYKSEVNHKSEAINPKINSSSFDDSYEHKNGYSEDIVILYHGKEYNSLQFATAFLEGDTTKAVGVMTVFLDKGQAKLVK